MGVDQLRDISQGLFIRLPEYLFKLSSGQAIER